MRVCRWAGCEMGDTHCVIILPLVRCSACEVQLVRYHTAFSIHLLPEAVPVVRPDKRRPLTSG